LILVIRYFLEQLLILTPIAMIAGAQTIYSNNV